MGIMNRAFLLVFLSYSILAGAYDDELDGGWSTTGANLKLVEYFFLEKAPCKRSSDNYYACLMFVDELASKLDPALRILPADFHEIASEPMPRRLTDSADSLVLAQRFLSKSNASRRDDLAAKHRLRVAVRAAASSIALALGVKMRE